MASKDISEQAVKNFIRSILIATPTVSTIQSLERDYKEQIGTSIPFHKFKYNSIEHFLKNLYDVCRVNGTGPFAQVIPVVSDKSAHINEMVTQQKVNLKGRFKCPRRRSKGIPTSKEYQPPQFNRRSSYNYSFSPNSSHESTVSGSNSDGSFPKYFSQNSCDKNSNINNQSNLVKSHSNHTFTTQFTKNQNGNKAHSSQTFNTQFTKNQNANEAIHVKTNPETNVDIVTPNELKSNKLRLLNLIKKQNELGSIRVPLEEPPDINTKGFTVPDNAPLLNESFELSIEKISNDTSAVHFEEIREEEDTSNVPKRVQNNLRSLISQFCNGIWCSDVPAHYRRLFKKELQYHEYGYTSLIEMCIALKHIFHYVRPGSDDFKLYDRSKPLPANVEKRFTMASFDTCNKVNQVTALPELDWSDFKGYIPEDICKFGDTIPNQFLPPDAKDQSVFEVVVVEIYDPSKFWFYLGSSNRNSPLDILMDSMQAFYKSIDNAKEYALSPGALREGLYCVQVIYGEYHRARIVRVLESSEYVKVLYIDYGTVCKALIKGMCFLHEKFAELPAQAIRARLANIVPEHKGHHWPRSCADRFRDLVNRRDTKIKISHIDRNEEIVYVFLADVTNLKKIVYINEKLVEEGHAVWEGERQVEPLVLSKFKCKVENLHLFPTFFELENGWAPNGSEMNWLQEMLVPIQFSLPQYFKLEDKVCLNDDEKNMNQKEISFIETVKNNRKFTSFSKFDVNKLIKPAPINLDAFGPLKNEISEFCKSIHLDVEQSSEVLNNEEAEIFCDCDEIINNNERRGSTLEETLQDETRPLIRENKDSPVSIFKELKNYSSLESLGASSDSEKSFYNKTTNLQPETLDTRWSPTEVAEIELAPIIERSEEDTLSTVSSSAKAFLKFIEDKTEETDVNIFDNPEAFHNVSDDSGSHTNPITPDIFLRTIENFSDTNLREKVVLSNNPFLTGETDLIKSNIPEAGSQIGHEQILATFIGKTEEEHIGTESAAFSEFKFSSSTDKSVTSDIKNLSTLSLNNPFREYFKEKENVTSKNESIDGNVDNTPTTPTSDRLTAPTNLLESQLKLLLQIAKSETGSVESLDTDSSDYNVSVSKQVQVNHTETQTTVPKNIPVTIMAPNTDKYSAPGSNTFSTPNFPYFRTGAFVPGFPYYPQWSNGFDMSPGSQYQQWNNVDHYGPPKPPVRVPPGFSPLQRPGLQRCMPPYFPPYMNGSPHPMYQTRPPCTEYMRHAAPPFIPDTKDFYTRFNQGNFQK